MEEQQYKRLERKLVKKGSIIEIYEDTMEAPNGHISKWDFIQHKGAAAIVPVDEDGKLLLVRQHRPSIGKMTLEIPAGGMNPGEDYKTCAMRELEEETGYRTEDAEPLLELFTTVAFCNEKIGIYYTEHLIPSEQNLDEDEFVTVERHSLEELVSMILRGEIQDGKTISAILAYQAKKNRQA